MGEDFSKRKNDRAGTFLGENDGRETFSAEKSDGADTVFGPKNIGEKYSSARGLFRLIMPRPLTENTVICVI